MIAYFHVTLDDWFRYGRAAYRGKVVTSCFALESLLIIAKTLQENDVASNCPYRPLAQVGFQIDTSCLISDWLRVLSSEYHFENTYQFSCSHDRCHECEVDHFNVSGLLKMQAVGILGLKLVQMLDIERRNDILR